jgi:hypothetical protein
MRRLPPALIAISASYLILILVVAALLPLQLTEMHQAFVRLNVTWKTLFLSIARIPGSVPIGFLVQLPFALLASHSRILLRLPSALSAVANGYLVWRLAKLTPVRTPLTATIVFLCLPIQFFAATNSRPPELALLFLLLATIQFLEIIQQPDLRKTIFYGLFLTLCLYAEPYSFLPAIGYALFLLRFSVRPAERRALWFLLPATATPAILFLPFYAWATNERAKTWLTERVPFSDQPLSTQLIHGLAPGSLWILAGAVLFGLLSVGLLAGVWSSFPPFNWPLRMRVNLFCLAGGSVCSLALAMAFAWAIKAPIVWSELLPAAPGLIILTFAALDWAIKSWPQFRSFAYPATAVMLVALGAPAIFEYLVTPRPDIGELVATARRNLTPGSCIVFVSEGESPFFFLLYDSTIWDRECHDFFSKRIVLASHAWVRPDQQRDAELFFRGLNFVETRRMTSSGGVVIVEEAR